MRSFIIATTVFAVCSTYGLSQAADPAVTCESNKLKTAGTYESCLLKAAAKGVKTATTPDYSGCQLKFLDKFVAHETKAGPGVCPTEGDVGDIYPRINRSSDALVLLLSGERYEDCGNGTVADYLTGLLWQKTDDAGGRRDKDNVYTWTTAVGGEIPDGTAFHDFLAGMNGALTGTTCFASFCDWRIPDIFELTTTLLAPYPCGTNPCIDQAVFGPMNAGAKYHSNRSHSSFTPRLYAYTLEYDDGEAHALELKNFPSKQVRAVRTGGCFY